MVNKKNLAYFKNLIEKMKRQQAELDRVKIIFADVLYGFCNILFYMLGVFQLNMDIQVELLDASDRAISVSASSVHGGNGEFIFQ